MSYTTVAGRLPVAVVCEQCDGNGTQQLTGQPCAQCGGRGEVFGFIKPSWAVTAARTCMDQHMPAFEQFLAETKLPSNPQWVAGFLAGHANALAWWQLHYAKLQAAETALSVSGH